MKLVGKDIKNNVFIVLCECGHVFRSCEEQCPKCKLKFELETAKDNTDIHYRFLFEDR